MSENAVLLPEAQWIDPVMTLREGADSMDYHLRAAIAYHGMDSIGGVVLGFRILQHAIDLYEGEEIPQRGDIHITTAFPGGGAKDSFEYLVRAVSQARYHCDTALSHPDAQLGFSGCFYFRVQIGDVVYELSPIPGQPPETFFTAGSRAFELAHDHSAQRHWRNEKIRLANTLLMLPAAQCIRQLAV